MSRALRNIYLLRVGFSVLWVTLIATASFSPTSGTAPSALVALLIAAYPAADLIASIADLRSNTTRRATVPQRINVIADAGAVTLVAVAATHSLTAAMNVFAGWAIASGAIQLVVGVRRLGRLRAQWLMIISGAGSIYAGTTFINWTQSPAGALHTLTQYSIGGAVWYLLTAIWLSIPATRAPAAIQSPP
jgi:uncharacterized membrane protein HdeD (DUF308 family)